MGDLVYSGGSIRPGSTYGNRRVLMYVKFSKYHKKGNRIVVKTIRTYSSSSVKLITFFMLYLVHLELIMTITRLSNKYACYAGLIPETECKRKKSIMIWIHTLVNVFFRYCDENRWKGIRYVPSISYTCMPPVDMCWFICFIFQNKTITVSWYVFLSIQI